jgi:hypothetical protein
MKRRLTFQWAACHYIREDKILQTHLHCVKLANIQI